MKWSEGSSDQSNCICALHVCLQRYGLPTYMQCHCGQITGCMFRRFLLAVYTHWLVYKTCRSTLIFCKDIHCTCNLQAGLHCHLNNSIHPMFLFWYEKSSLDTILLSFHMRGNRPHFPQKAIIPLEEQLQLSLSLCSELLSEKSTQRSSDFSDIVHLAWSLFRTGFQNQTCPQS